MSDTKEHGDSLNRVTEIVSAYVSGNSVPANQVPELIMSVHQTLMHVSGQAPEIPTPAVPINKSVTQDYIICLEDGKQFKMLKRHLKAAFNLSPQQYREKWGLPEDYPLVAPKYVAKRRKLAKKLGLGKAGKRPGRSERKAAA